MGILDIIAFGAHPDDCEIGAGAFLLKMKKKGYRTGLITLTEGDMGRGNPKERRKETFKAAKILKVDTVEIHDLGDCRLEDNHENRIYVASIIRKYQPDMILCPYWGIEPGRGRGHADHIACGHLVTHAANFAHLAKYPADGEPHAVKRILYYFLSPYHKPSFIVPVDDELLYMEKAIRQHVSQFGPQDYHNRVPSMLDSLGRFYGAMIGSKYGQPFMLNETLPMEDPFDYLVKKRPVITPAPLGRRNSKPKGSSK